MTQNAAQTPDKNPESTQFGTRNVTPDEKTGLVRDVFDSVADQYDVMNDVMSGGVHRLWKNHLIRRIRPKAGLHYLDVAGGTGDIAFRIKDYIDKRKNQRPPAKSLSSAHDSSFTLCDLNWDMLRVGRNRAINKGHLDDYDWITGNAETLPLEDNSVDVYTIAFGLRNVTRIDDGLKEAHRVLKSGGRFYCLEFSHVENPALAALYEKFSFGVIPKMGELITKDRESYQYLVESIRKFPTQENLKERLEKAGFTRVSYENLTFGIAAIHYGIKI